MTFPNQQTVTQTVPEDDPWESADNAKPQDYQFFGQVHLNIWYGFFPGNKAVPIPFDPAQHPQDKKVTIIDAQIIPIPEQNITKDVKQNFTDFSQDWTRIVLPSIKALNLSGTRELNGKFVRVALVNGKRKRLDKDTGADTGEFWKTWEFKEVFADETACRAAYAGNGHSAPPTEPPPVQTPLPGQVPTSHTPDQETALKFAAIPVKKACSGKTANDTDAILVELRAVLAGMPMVNKHFTADSPEILTLIMQELSK